MDVMAARLDRDIINSQEARRTSGAGPGKLSFAYLKVFCDVAETGSFSAAARKNQVGCDVVSYEVLALEHYFDVPLLERERENNRLTVAGRALYDHSQQMLQTYAALEARFGETGRMKDET